MLFKRFISKVNVRYGLYSTTLTHYEPPDEGDSLRQKQRQKVKEDDNDFTGTEWVKEYAMKISWPHDYSPHTFRDWYIGKQFKAIRDRQICDIKTLKLLGPDLTLAYIVTSLGGAVKCLGDEKWYFEEPRQKKLKSKHPGIVELPKQYRTDFKLEAIDASGTHIMYEGLSCLSSLKHLKYLSLRRGSFIDDFCLQRVSLMSHSLEFLDVSYCPQISQRGLSLLWPLRKLKRFVAYGLPFMEDKEMVCLLLEEKLPNLYIEGVDYMLALPEDSKRRLVQSWRRIQSEERTLLLKTDNQQQ